MKPLLLLLIAFAPSLRAHDTAAPNLQHISTAAAWLSSAEPAKRKAAISTFRTMPASAMVHYKTALEAARKANDSSNRSKGNPGDLTPIGLFKRSGRAHQQQTNTRLIKHKHKGHQNRWRNVFPGLECRFVGITLADRRSGKRR
jgi:hypothetical protein